jgi:AcrR family transcriptional regulator
MGPTGAYTLGRVSADASLRILEAACGLIAEEGIEAVRIARVARRAGASTALVHHYFSTREELLEQALVHSFERAGDERFGGEGTAPDGTATEALAEAIAESLPYPGTREREWVLWVELWLRAVRDPELRPLAARMYGRYRDWISGLIAAGVESGEFDGGIDAEAAADFLISLLDGSGIRAMVSTPSFEVDAARELIAERLAPVLGISPDSLLR